MPFVAVEALCPDPALQLCLGHFVFHFVVHFAFRGLQCVRHFAEVKDKVQDKVGVGT
jgi:hypothetical protein